MENRNATNEDDFNAYNESLSRRIRLNNISDYLEGLDISEQECIEPMADDLLANGKPLADTVVIIPVAAHQDSALVLPALEQYAKVMPKYPFSVVLGLNQPADESDDSGMQRCRDAIKQAEVRFPHLDVRVTDQLYAEPVIGEIRRDLWNTVLLASSLMDNFKALHQVIGINHDIDVVRMSPWYIHNIQERYESTSQESYFKPSPPAYASWTKHAISLKHPRISRVVAWCDYLHRKSDAGYEAGIIIPFSLYAEHGGFSRTQKFGEVNQFLDKLHNDPHVVRGTSYETSIRRFVSRMNSDGLNVWSAETFTATDDCRSELDYPDISRARQLEVVEEHIPAFSSMLKLQAETDARRQYNRRYPENVILDDEDKRKLAAVVHRKMHTEQFVKQVASRAGKTLRFLIGSDELRVKFEEEMALDVQAAEY